MAKNVVFCADGTWNGPSEPDADSAAPATNVFKLFLNLAGQDVTGTLALAKEQERALQSGSVTQQIAKYLHGVGDSNNFLVKLLGGLAGSGLIARIVRGYTFISRNYAAGDQIFIIGFSRGAYTARALAGLISASGLLDATKFDLSDKTNAYRLGSAVWYQHLAAVRQHNPDLLGRLQELAVDLPAFFGRPPSASQLIHAPLAAVAVWDTVGSLGIPEFNLKMERLDAFQFADRQLSPVVKQGRHAIAVDEQRSDFTPTLWDTDPRVVQVLFPGSHSDVGGGYPAAESGLSDCALDWMTVELDKLGVLFADSPVSKLAVDPLGPAHQPWVHPPWNFLVRAQRAFPLGLTLADSLTARRHGGAVIAEPGSAAGPYLPGNLAGYPS